MELLLLGTINNSHGLKGAIRFISFSHFIEERLQTGNTVYIGKDKDNCREFKVENFNVVPKFIILKLQEINSVEEADKLKGQYIYVSKEDLVLDKGVYYFSDLEKCEVIDEKNNLLGNVIKVEEFPAQITLRVKNKKGKQFFVPFIKEFIIDVDMDNKKIKVKIMEGML